MSPDIESGQLQAGGGFNVVGSTADGAPGIVTIALPEQIDSVQAGHALQVAGYDLSFNSDYLVQRNWLQISLMSQPSVQQLRAVVHTLRRLCKLRTQR